MGIRALLKCIGFLTIVLISSMIAPVPMKAIGASEDVIAAATRLLMLLAMGTIVFFVNKKNHFIIWKPTKKLRFLMPPSIVAGIGMAFFSSLTFIIFMLLGRELPEAVMIGNEVFFFFSAIIASSIMEELFFRGIIFNMCRPYFGPTIAIILSALLFALAHIHPAKLPQTFVVGILLGYFYYYTGNIFVPAMMHMSTNITVLCMVFLTDPFTLLLTDSFLLLLLIILCFTGIIIIFIAKKFFDKILTNTKEINNEER